MTGAVLELLDLSGETGTSRALRESEQRLRLAVEATHIGIWDVDATRGTRRWSPEFNAIMGLPAAFEGDEETFEALIHPDDQARALELYRRAYTPGSGGIYNAEFRIRRADTGEVRWVLATGHVNFGVDGQPLRGVGTLNDIDRRRKDEEALRESERRLRVALVAGRMGAWSYDLIDGTQRWDQSQYRLLGLDPSLQPSRELFLSIVHPDDRKLVEFETETLPLDTFLDSEFRIVRPDGTVRWISAQSIAHAGPDGKPMEMIGVNRDMTAQKDAETALRISEERQRLAVEANDVGTWDFDILAGEHRWSTQFRKLWGLPDDAPADSELLQSLVDATDWAKIRDRWQAACDPAGDGRFNFEYQIRRADDGARRWVMLSGRIFFDDARRRAVRAVGVMLDTTERREAEERQRLILKELNHRVKNNLAVVQAIVSQTMRMSPKPAEAFERIQARLMAIARTHDFLNMSDWGGVSLERLLQGELEPHASLDRERLVVAGQTIVLELDLGAVARAGVPRTGDQRRQIWRPFRGDRSSARDLGIDRRRRRRSDGQYRLGREPRPPGAPAAPSGFRFAPHRGQRQRAARRHCRDGIRPRGPALPHELPVAARDGSQTVLIRRQERETTRIPAPASDRSSPTEAEAEAQPVRPVVPAAAEVPAAPVVPGAMALIPAGAAVPTPGRGRRATIVPRRRRVSARHIACRDVAAAAAIVDPTPAPAPTHVDPRAGRNGEDAVVSRSRPGPHVDRAGGKGGRREGGGRHRERRNEGCGDDRVSNCHECILHSRIVPCRCQRMPHGIVPERPAGTW